MSKNFDKDRHILISIFTNADDADTARVHRSSDQYVYHVSEVSFESVKDAFVDAKSMSVYVVGDLERGVLITLVNIISWAAGYYYVSSGYTVWPTFKSDIYALNNNLQCNIDVFLSGGCAANTKLQCCQKFTERVSNLNSSTGFPRAFLIALDDLSEALADHKAVNCPYQIRRNK